MSGYIGLSLAFAGGLTGGLGLAVGFIIGWKAHKRVEDTGKLVGRIKQYDPVQNMSREAQIEREKEGFDLGDYEV